MKMKDIYLDYVAISKKVELLKDYVKEREYDSLVILLRGGYYVGFQLAYFLELPYYFVNFDRSENKPKWFGDKASGRKILLCEDFAGKGVTLVNTKKYLESEGYLVDTFVVCKDTLSASEPTFYCFDNQNKGERFILPWERYRINLESNLKQYDSELELEHTAWEADLFVKDNRLFQEVRMYDRIIFKNEDQYKKYKSILSEKPLIPIIEDSVDKGEFLINNGSTRFATSNSEEAILISKKYPQLSVFWVHDDKRIAISAV
jgi:hypoxanthine phosphoribosyltransferase